MKDCPDIFSTLEKFHRYELEDFRRFFGLDIPPHLHKREVVKRLGSFIIDSPRVWLRRLPERDLLLLRSLVQAGPGAHLPLTVQDYPSVLEVSNLVRTGGDSDYSFLWLPKAMYDLVTPYLDDVIAEAEADGSFRLERALLGYLQFYGILSLDELCDCMAEYLDRPDLSSDDIAWILNDCPMFKIVYLEVEGKELCVSPNIRYPYDVMEVLNQRQDIGRRHFTPEEAVKAGTGAPMFVFGLDTPEGVELVETLTALGYSGSDLVRAEHDIWMNSQLICPDISTEQLFSSVNDRQDDFPSFESYDRSMQVVADYANSLPKWVLGGHSASQADRKKVLVQSGEDPFDAMIKDNPLLGLFIYPVPGDEECPCGSGFSYRNCHGRFKS
ncbi:MAG: SEC-C domain-containing protein [Candidatus Cryptobacteroides sp.]